jgi:type IV pilus assembly protein PilQ
VDSVTRVPFFGDLPFIGALFRSTSKDDSKEELLIFVTPKILKEAVAAAAK